jgi:tetratricopeptide (TPR) repeat protein
VIERVVLLSLLLAGAEPQGGWPAVWDELDRLRTLPAGTGEAAPLERRLLEVVRESAGDPRSELLRSWLEMRATGASAPSAAGLVGLAPGLFESRERWLLAEALGPGPERAKEVLAGLEDPTPLARWQLLLAWNAAVEEARALRLPGAVLPIQERLHERYQADWSALDLAITLRWLGRAEAADGLLEETIAREAAAGRPTAELWSQRGIAALGFGDEERGRDYLGRALALGSKDAHLVLARLALQRGDLEAARRGFRALILDDPPQDWAWRGWGTTLLPAAKAAPARKPKSTPITD